MHLLFCKGTDVRTAYAAADANDDDCCCCDSHKLAASHDIMPDVQAE
jgi:hypothetical protein